MKFTKYIAASLLITSLGTAITPLISSSSVYADNIETVTNNTDNIVEKDGIYQACKSVGMPDWMAWTVAKALTMIAL